MPEQEIGTADGWLDLGKDDRHSTVAYFEGGAECVTPIGDAERGDEVHIWRGVAEVVEDEEGVREVCRFDGYDDEEVPDGSTHLVLTLKNTSERPVNERFAQSLEDAREIAQEETQRVNDGEYNES